MDGNLGRRLRRISLRLSVTDRCNLCCTYCRPACAAPSSVCAIPASDDELLDLVELINQKYPIYKLRVTGGEPLLRPGIPTLIRGLRRLLPHAQIGLTTNGILLPRYAVELRDAGLESVNISLDTTDPAAFAKLTRGGRLARVLDGIAAARRAGIKRLKINSILLRSYTRHQLVDLVRTAAANDCEIRFIELMPFGEGARLYGEECFSATEALSILRETFGYIGPMTDSATARRHRLDVDGREQVVGFITTMSAPFCAGCDRFRLDSRGRLLSCLRSAGGPDLLGLLRAGANAQIRQCIRETVRGKSIPVGAWPEYSMVEVGG